MAAGSLAAYMQGRLSLKDFEWPQSRRPTLPFNSYLNSHLIPEIDLRALLSCAGAGVGPRSDSPNGKLAANESGPAPSREHALLLEAATTCGFFQVYNHPIPISALETLDSYARKFFSMPLEHKLEAAKLLGDLITGFNFHSGYMCGSPIDSLNKSWHEAVRVSSFNKSNISAVARCLWPDEADQQAFGTALQECSKGFAKISEQLALILLQELDIDAEEVFSEYVKGEHTEAVKFSHYPACPQPDVTWGLPVHTDVSLLTFVWQDDVGGLQVQLDGQWITVKPRRDALVVNIGDILQVWSNDRFQSGAHRVVLNSIQSRHSIAFVCNASVDSMVAPLPQLLKRTGESPKFRSIQHSEYRRYAIARIFQDEWQGVDYLRC